MSHFRIYIFKTFVMKQMETIKIGEDLNSYYLEHCISPCFKGMGLIYYNDDVFK